MAAFVYYKEELIGRYDSSTKEILDKLINESTEKTFLVRQYKDEADLPKLVSRAQRSRDLANIIMGFNRDFEPSPLRGSDPNGALGTIKIGSNYIKYQSFSTEHFITEENKYIYFSSSINVFTNESYADIIGQYAKSGRECMLSNGWTKDTKNYSVKVTYRTVPSYALLVQAGIKIDTGPGKQTCI